MTKVALKKSSRTVAQSVAQDVLTPGPGEVDISAEATALLNHMLQAGSPAGSNSHEKLIQKPLESRSEQYKVGLIISLLKDVGDKDELQRIFDAVASEFGLMRVGPSPMTSIQAPKPHSSTNTLQILENAPALYRDRADRHETAEQFLRRVYKPWLEARSLYQFQIGKVDPQLLQGLKNQFKGRADGLRELLPRKKDEVSQRVVSLVGGEVADPLRRRLLAQAERVISAAQNKPGM